MGGIEFHDFLKMIERLVHDAVLDEDFGFGEVILDLGHRVVGFEIHFIRRFDGKNRVVTDLFEGGTFSICGGQIQVGTGCISFLFDGLDRLFTTGYFVHFCTPFQVVGI